jgi:uncharacterized phage protein gp47/JayE
MAFTIPTLSELSQSVRQSFRANLPGTDGALWPNNIYVSAKVMAQAVFGNYLWLDYIKRQAFVSTADAPFLDYHGKQYGLVRLPSGYAIGKIDILGDPGTVISVGSVFSRADGLEYKALEAVQLSGNGTTTVQVRALEPGKNYNALPGVSLESSNAIMGISSVSVHDDGIGLGSDDEETEPYRSRILFHLQNPPHGGAEHDYVEWCRKINGVTAVFVDPLWSGAGTVGVYFLMRDHYENGLPLVADVAGVQAYIDVVRPITAIVSVMAPEGFFVAVEITDLSPDTVSVRDAIRLELADLFEREMLVSTSAKPFVLRRSKIWEAISRATGEDSHTLVLPAADIPIPSGHLPVLTDVNFV